MMTIIIEAAVIIMTMVTIVITIIIIMARDSQPVKGEKRGRAEAKGGDQKEK